MGVRRFLILLLALILSAPAAAQPAGSSRFDGWTSIIVAADWRTSQGQPIQAFDNARRDLADSFTSAGFNPDLMASFSLRPDVESPVTIDAGMAAIAGAARRGTRGCFVYVTSHGTPEAIVFGPDGRMSPRQLASNLDRWCGARPTVVVVSACFSGVFIPALSAPNRMVLTAARPDRSSFGCSEEATYPYFDGCVLQALPTATHFLDLAAGARACVARREQEEGLRPASEPQLFVGGDMQILLPTLRFNR